MGTWPPRLGLPSSEGREDWAVGLGAEEWGGAEGAARDPVSPGAVLGPLEQAAEWPPQFLAGAADSQDGRDGVEAETAVPAPGCFSRPRASSTICAVLWRRQKTKQTRALAPLHPRLKFLTRGKEETLQLQICPLA